MTTMTSAEQLILEMINRARMDPDGEAARLAQTHPGFTLNEGLAAGTISSTPKQVLAGNNTLAGVADRALQHPRCSRRVTPMATRSPNMRSGTPVQAAGIWSSTEWRRVWGSRSMSPRRSSPS